MSPRKRSRALEKTPPPPEALGRLTPYKRTPSGRPSQWRDPITAKIYSNRKRQEARQGGISIEDWKRLKHEGGSKARRAIERSTSEVYSKANRKHIYINYTHLAKLYAQTQGIDRADVWDTPDYWRAVGMIQDMVTGKSKRDISEAMIDAFGTDSRDDWFNSGGETE